MVTLRPDDAQRLTINWRPAAMSASGECVMLEARGLFGSVPLNWEAIRVRGKGPDETAPYVCPYPELAPVALSRFQVLGTTWGMCACEIEGHPGKWLLLAKHGAPELPERLKRAPQIRARFTLPVEGAVVQDTSRPVPDAIPYPPEPATAQKGNAEAWRRGYMAGVDPSMYQRHCPYPKGGEGSAASFRNAWCDGFAAGRGVRDE